MFYVKIKSDFDAAHRVVGYNGKCNRLHGHTWTVEAVVKGKKLDELGMLADFKLFKQNLMGILEEFDHFVLNELPPFHKINPTAEILAQYIFERLKNSLNLPEEAILDEVSVWESPHSVAVYREQE